MFFSRKNKKPERDIVHNFNKKKGLVIVDKNAMGCMLKLVEDCVGLIELCYGNVHNFAV